MNPSASPPLPDRITNNGLEYDAYSASRQVLYVPGLVLHLAFSGEAKTRAIHVKAQEMNVVMHRS
jgi:hypothetical protein